MVSNFYHTYSFEFQSNRIVRRAVRTFGFFLSGANLVGNLLESNFFLRTYEILEFPERQILE